MIGCNQERSKKRNKSSVYRPVVVFDEYSTFGGEYEGKLFITVSDVDPTRTEMYIWRNGKVEEVTELHQQIEQKEKAWAKHLAKISPKHWQFLSNTPKRRFM